MLIRVSTSLISYMSLTLIICSYMPIQKQKQQDTNYQLASNNSHLTLLLQLRVIDYQN